MAALAKTRSTTDNQTDARTHSAKTQGCYVPPQGDRKFSIATAAKKVRSSRPGVGSFCRGVPAARGELGPDLKNPSRRTSGLGITDLGMADHGTKTGLRSRPFERAIFKGSVIRPLTRKLHRSVSPISIGFMREES